MRESLLGSRVSTLFVLTAEPSSGAQAGSAMHVRSGTEPGFWKDEPGTEYGITVTTRVFRATAAALVFSDCVFVSDQTRRRLSVPALLNTATELNRNSVPPLS